MTNPIIQAAATTKTAIPSHFATLLGERPAGSQWGRDFTDADWELPWQEQQDPGPCAVPGCRYFRLDAEAVAQAFPRATVQAIPMSELDIETQRLVEPREGAHGPELAIKRSKMPLETPQGPQEAWIILGDHEGQEVVFTAHPGPLMMPCPKDGQVPVQLPVRIPFAVKIV